jgi:PAS domain S-box-containing protein
MQLRDQAEARLKAGTAPPTQACAIGADTLQLLYQLSSDPKRAGEALKLLHELQVHQVELDLQSGQLATTESELAAELAHYRELFHFAPLGYFLLDKDGTIVDGNRAAAELVSVAWDGLYGGQLEAYLTPDSALTLQAMLQRLAQAGSNESCTLAIQGPNHSSRQLQVMAGRAPFSGNILLACCLSESALLM